MIGEVACYLGLPRSASVVADQDSSAFRITKDALERMRTENAELAVAFHEFRRAPPPSAWRTTPRCWRAAWTERVAAYETCRHRSAEAVFNSESDISRASFARVLCSRTGSPR